MRSFANGSVTASAKWMQLPANTMRKGPMSHAQRSPARRGAATNEQRVPARREATSKLICGCGGYMRWRIGLISLQGGTDHPGAHGVNSLSGLRGYGGQIPASREPMADDQWLIMSDRCPAVRCAPERQAGPASGDSCSKIQMLNAKCSVLNALHPRYPCRSFTPCAPGRLSTGHVASMRGEDHGFHGLKRIRGATFNVQRVPSRRGTTSDGKFVL